MGTGFVFLDSSSNKGQEWGCFFKLSLPLVCSHSVSSTQGFLSRLQLLNPQGMKWRLPLSLHSFFQALALPSAQPQAQYALVEHRDKRQEISITVKRDRGSLGIDWIVHPLLCRLCHPRAQICMCLSPHGLCQLLCVTLTECLTEQLS